MVNPPNGIAKMMRQGGKVWYHFSDRKIRSDKHDYATANYIHFNPVKHEYVKKAKEWPLSSPHHIA